MVDLTISLTELEYFLLMLARVSAFVFAAPIFSINGAPSRVKAGFAILLSYLLYLSIGEHPYYEYNTLIGYAIILLKESAVGVIMGFATNIPTLILQFAGRFIDTESGIAMAQTFDPMTRQSLTLTGSWYQYMIYLVMLVTGVHRYLIRALADSFVLIPTGMSVFRFDELNLTMLTFMGEYIKIAFRVSLPVFAAMLLVNAVLGVLAKIAPQMNMFTVGIQIKIFAAFGIMIVAASMLPSVVEFIMSEMKEMLRRVITDLMA